MRFTKTLAVTLAAGFAALALTTASDARADDEFDIKVGKGSVTVTPKGHWHVNDKYPWKVQAGDKKFTKKDFKLSEKSAAIKGLPAGKATIKGGVCSGDQCKNFSKEITVK